MFDEKDIFSRPIELRDISVDGRSPDKSCRKIERAVRSFFAEHVHPTVYATLREIRATHHGGKDYTVEVDYEEYDGRIETVEVEHVDVG